MNFFLLPFVVLWGLFSNAYKGYSSMDKVIKKEKKLNIELFHKT